jgi:hypothetical protein
MRRLLQEIGSKSTRPVCAPPSGIVIPITQPMGESAQSCSICRRYRESNASPLGEQFACSGARREVSGSSSFIRLKSRSVEVVRESPWHNFNLSLILCASVLKTFRLQKIQDWNYIFTGCSTNGTHTAVSKTNCLR